MPVMFIMIGIVCIENQVNMEKIHDIYRLHATNNSFKFIL